MEEWATREVELAKEWEKRESDDHSFDGYVDACYDSALKAYKSMCEDGHSGMSWSITVGILTKLLKEVPLTPIEENEDDMWIVYGDGHAQSKRRHSLFRDIQPDGTYKYHDIDAVGLAIVNPDGHITTVSSRFGDYICDKLFGPIVSFPYRPPMDRYWVRCFEFSARDGSDIYYVHFIKKPNGTVVEINSFFKHLGGESISIISREEAEKSLGEKIDLEKYIENSNNKR